MSSHFLCGILESNQTIPEFLRQQNRCRPLYWPEAKGLLNAENLWENLKLPEDCRPTFFLLRLGLAPVPSWVWSIPVPIVAIVENLDCLWHHHRLCLPHCALAFADPESAACLQRSGLDMVRGLMGLERLWTSAQEKDSPPQGGGELSPDIDVLVVGLPHPYLDRDGLTRMRTWARMGERYRVLCAQGDRDELAKQISRARLVLMRARDRDRSWIENCARESNAAVFVEEETCPSAVARFLDHEEDTFPQPSAISCAAVWDQLLDTIDKESHLLTGKARNPARDSSLLLARCRHLMSAGPRGDPSLIGDLSRQLARELDSPGLHVAVGLATTVYGHSQGEITAAEIGSALEEFRRALILDPNQALARLNLVEALALLGNKDAAAQEARLGLADLDRATDNVFLMDEAGHFPPGVDEFSVAWERAGQRNAGHPEAEAAAKKGLIGWRLHQPLADLTGTSSHYFEAALAFPDSSSTRAALGSALARAGMVAEGVNHLRLAVQGDRLDLKAAGNLYHAMGETGDHLGQQRLARDLWLLSRMIPTLPPEPWFAGAPPAEEKMQSVTAPGDRVVERHTISSPVPDAPINPHSAECGYDSAVGPRPRVSLCMIVKDEEGNLPDCLASVAGLTDEIIIVDTGSTDRTREIALKAGAKVFDFPWVDDFAAARNESIRHATGEWIFWLDADDRLDEDNRQKLRELFESLPFPGAASRSGVQGADNIAYVVKCLCLPDRVTGTATVVDHVRLFRNDPRIRWKYRIHEQILTGVRQAGGQTRWSDVVIQHTGYQDATRLGPKLERAVRLLQMDLADNPQEPFTLFNLGWSYMKMGRPAEALPYLESSLTRSQPGDSIVRKIYALLIQSHKALGNADQALDLCRQGRRVCPDDAEIVFEEGCLTLEQGNLPAAETCFIQLLERKPGTYFASVDPALHGYKSRHCLGMVYQRQKRFAEAASQWQAVLAEKRDYLPTLLGLGELHIEQHHWEKLEELAQTLDGLPNGQVESAILRAQGHMARKEFEPAKILLSETKRRFPDAFLPRIVFSHALLQEDRDPDAAEHALREVLVLDPHHQPTQQNLRVLMNRKGVSEREVLTK